MATNDKNVDKNLDAMASSAARAAKSLEEAASNLSNRGVDKFTDAIKKHLKQTELVTESQIDQIKSFKDLTSVIKKLDDQVDSLVSQEKALEKNLKIRLADAKALGKKAEQSVQAQHDLDVKSLKESIAIRKKEIDSLSNIIDANGRYIKATDIFSKAVEKHTDSIKTQVAKWTSIGTGLNMIGEAAKQLYSDMNTYSQKGLLGAFASMSFVSKKLLMTGMEFSEIVNKNRDLVNKLGGGVKGIEAFADQIDEASSGLGYMGKEGKKAAARFVEMNKNLGLTNKSTIAYKQTMEETKNTFKKFSGLFGDSYEEFAQLIESQEEEENVRRRLNNMSEKDIALSRKELLVRTDNMKMMGLSNQQIMEFNKRTEEMNNPRKSGQIGTRMKEGQMAKNAIAMLQNSGTSEGAALGKYSGQLNSYFEMSQKGDATGMKNFAGSKEGMEALNALSKARSSIDQLDQYKREGINRVSELAGGAFSGAINVGDNLATADRTGKNLGGLPKADLDATIEANRRMQEGLAEIGGKTVDLGKIMDATSTAVEGVRAILNDPFTKAIFGVMVTLAGLAIAARSAIGAFAAIRAASGLPDIGVDGKDSKGGKGNWKSKAGKVGLNLMKGLGIGIALDAVSSGLEIGAEKAKANGHETAGDSLSIGSSTAQGAGYGAAIGSVVPGIGTLAGAAIGGLGGAAVGVYKQGRMNSILPDMLKSNTPGNNQAPLKGRESSGKLQGSIIERKAALESQMDKAGITDPKERAAFLAQMDHESGGFKYMTELGANAGQQYEGRKDLGNNQTGDGQKYKGRGFIQLTGRANYEKYGKIIGQDLVNNPELAADPAIGAQIATAYWKDRKLGEKLKTQGFDAVTKGINGGFNGKTDRDQKFAMYQGQTGSNQITNMMNPNLGGSPTTTINPPLAATIAGNTTSQSPMQVTVNDPNSSTMVSVLQRIENNTRGQRGGAYQQPPGSVSPNIGG